MNIPFLSDIEQLINEHGSAVILKQRLELAADKFLALQQELDRTRVECSQLAARNTELESANHNLQSQVLNREEQIDNLSRAVKQQQQTPDRYRPEIEAILKVISTHEHGCHNSILLQKTSINRIVATSHTEKLLAADMIGKSFSSDDCGAVWWIHAKGCDYLVQHGLVDGD